MKIKLYGAAAGAVAVFAGGTMYSQSTDLTSNYTPVNARISAVEVECFIEARNKKITNDGSDSLAYMDCEIAPMVAAMHDMKEKDIKQRVSASYIYISPVDGQRHEGDFTRRGRDRAADFTVGSTVPVFAHNSDAAKFRTVSANYFVDDAYKI